VNRFLHRLYGCRRCRVRKAVLKIVDRLEGGEHYSPTLRAIFRDYHDVDIGMYTHGGCFEPGRFDRFTTVGRYCSISRTARAMNRDHPVSFRSTHAFFFNPVLGHVDRDLIEYTPLNIGHDVWFGHNSVIMPGVREIATGAVIAAGAVVNKNVPPYAVVVGNPARVVRYRFAPQIIEGLLRSEWWEKSIEELKQDMAAFQTEPAAAMLEGVASN
jgi:acetyltransferase-like isoleucine patch superfamily enzyme